MAHYGTVSKICGPFSKTFPSQVYEWKILEFYSHISQDFILSGPVMYFMGTNFCFTIDPTIRNRSGSQRQICVQLKTSPYAWRCPTQTVHFTLGIKIANEATENVLFKGEIRKETKSFTKDFLLSELLKYNTEREMNTLTVITFTFWIGVAPRSVKDVTILSRETRTEGLPDSGARARHKMGKYLATKDFFQTILSRETRTEGLRDSDARGKHKMGTYLATKGKNLVSQETQTEDVSENAANRKECEVLEPKDVTVVSRETQTEDLPESGARGEECTHIDTEGVDDLRKHFKSLLLDGQDHDVKLKVGDKVFKAHKDILRARSPVFAAMFAHNMRESECGDVTIEDCDPEAFGEFLQFVYTGKVDSLTPSNALGLYYASDKYDFPSLKEMCVEYLKTSLSTNMVCDVISMAMKHNEEELLDNAMTFFMDHMMEIS